MFTNIPTRHAVLIGETLMRAEDTADALMALTAGGAAADGAR